MQILKDEKISNGLKISYGLVLILNDLFFLALSCFLSYYLRFFTRLFGVKPTFTISDNYIFYSLIFLIAAVLIFFLLRLYSVNAIYRDGTYYFKIFIPPTLSLVLVLTFGWFYQKFSFSRLWIVILFIVSLLFLFFSRFLIGILTKKIFLRFHISGIKIDAGFKENLSALKYLSRFKKKIIYGAMLIVADILFLVLAFYLSYFLRFRTGILAESGQTFIIEKNYIFYSIIFILSAIFLFFVYGLYDRDKIYRGSGYYSKLLKAISINMIVIIVAGYLFNLFTFSRKWILLLYLLSIVLLYINRAFIETLTQKITKRLGLKSRTIIIGAGENAKRIEDSLRKYSKEEDMIMGHVDRKKRIMEDKEYYDSFTILGYLENLGDIIYRNNIQRVIISGPEFKYDEILDILESLKGMDVTVLLFPGFFEFSLRRLSVREIGGVPLMQVANIGFFGINLFFKNLTDYLLGSIFFLFFMPIYLIAAVLIKIDSKGPVFFMQKRLTKDCREFYMYKFRTMYVDAEDRLKELMKYNEADGPLFKMKNDPRITRIGRFLRKFSIDEIPQIINVLKGDMSLVGPRPPLKVEVEKYGDWEMKRMNVKQGMTGLWQISGRSDLSFEEMARLDLYYIQNWSFEMDVKIILRTLPAALSSRGAY